MGHFFYFIGKMVVNCVQKDTKKHDDLYNVKS